MEVLAPTVKLPRHSDPSVNCIFGFRGELAPFLKIVTGVSGEGDESKASEIRVARLRPFLGAMYPSAKSLSAGFQRVSASDVTHKQNIDKIANKLVIDGLLTRQ